MGNTCRSNPPPFTSVSIGEPEVLAMHPDQTLLLCWPPREEPEVPGAVANMGFSALRAYTGNTVIYVGELRGMGATAGPLFHNELADQWDLQSQCPLPQWPGAHDTLTIWRRRQASTTRLPSRSICAATAVTSKHWEDACLGSEQAQLERQEQRKQVINKYKELWEEGAVAHMLARVKAGGAGARPGLEKDVLEAVCARSNFIRRTFLRVLRA
mmetsp:Transcript_738/g.1555  ORF Transcript_738/g.1555 Transcript_738/m.1555 type:complete len:213 (-) Transcript_738:90-728(-)